MKTKFTSQYLLRRACASVLLAFVFCSCSDRTSSLMGLVPQESCAVLSVDWSSIKNDDALSQIIKARELEQWLQRLQIDGKSIRNIVVFSGITSNRISGLLLRGAFDSKQVVAELKNQGWSEDSLDGNKVYAHTSEYIALPSKNTLFAGTREAASGVFRARSSAKESILGSSSYKKLNSGISTTDRRPVTAFLVIPEGTLDMADAALTATSFAVSFFDLGGIGQLLKAVNVARGFAFTLDHGNHEAYPVELCILMRDQDAAVFVSGSLNAMKNLSELVGGDARHQQAIREFRKMTITRRDEVLAVRLEMPADALFPRSTR